MQIAWFNTSAHVHMGISPLPRYIYVCGSTMYISALSQVLYYTCETKALHGNTVIQYTGVSRYNPINLGVLHRLPLEILAPCSWLPGCAECASSPTCSVWWCAGDSLASKIGPLHVQSWKGASSLHKWTEGPHQRITWWSVLVVMLPLCSLVSQQILLSEWHDEGGSIVTEMSELLFGNWIIGKYWASAYDMIMTHLPSHSGLCKLTKCFSCTVSAETFSSFWSKLRFWSFALCSSE